MQDADSEPPAKMTKLAIVEDREEDKYEHLTLLKHWPSDPVQGLPLPELNTAAGDPLIKSLVDGVLNSMSSARQSEVKAWEEEIMACEHTLTLEQLATGAIQGSGKYLSPIVWFRILTVRGRFRTLQ